MFYCEFDFRQQPQFMKDEVSSCVWHKDAIRYEKARTVPASIWTQKTLTGLLSKHCLDIQEILTAVCCCDTGTAISMPANPEVVAAEFKLEGPILFIQAGNLPDSPDERFDSSYVDLL
jgi:hypothetical protein